MEENIINNIFKYFEHADKEASFETTDPLEIAINLELVNNFKEVFHDVITCSDRLHRVSL